MNAITTRRFVPLWARPGADPVRLRDLKPADPKPAPKPKPDRPRRDRPVVAIAEPEIGLGELRFQSIARAARSVGLSHTGLMNSIATGCRAGGRLWWYADRPLRERPSLPTFFRNMPVMVGERLYPSIKAAAGEFGVSVGTFGNYRRRGHLPRRFGGLHVRRLERAA